MPVSINGHIWNGFGGATNAIELQKPEVRKYFPQIDVCRSGTINVHLQIPLDVRIPDFGTPSIAWQPGPGERFAITKVELEVLQQHHEAWIYVAEFSPHRFNYTMSEIVARPINGLSPGLPCTVHIERFTPILVV